MDFSITVPLTLLLLVTSSLKLVLIKFLDKNEFNFVPIQTLIVFFSESICLVIYFYSKKPIEPVIDEPQVQVQPQAHYEPLNGPQDESLHEFQDDSLRTSLPSIFALSLIDILASVCVYHSIIHINLSEYQLVKTSIILFTLFYSIIIMGKIINTYEIIGGLIITTGLFIVVYFSPTHDYLWLVIFAQCLVAFQLVYEEFIIKNNSIEPLLLIGLEGVFGTCVILIYLTINAFSETSREHYFSESIHVINNKPDLIPIIALISLLTMIDCVIGITITTKFSSFYRVIVDIFKLVLINVISVVFGLEVNVNREFIVSFNLIILGIIVFNLRT